MPLYQFYVPECRHFFFFFLVAMFLHENGKIISRMKQKVQNLDLRDAFQRRQVGLF